MPGTKVITSVPGTFTSLFNFYDGGVQQVSGYLTKPDSGAVAFVYKDGVFPGENQDTGEMNPLRVFEANDQAFGRAAGVTMAGFEEGMRTDPLLEAQTIETPWGAGNVWGGNNPRSNPASNTAPTTEDPTTTSSTTPPRP